MGMISEFKEFAAGGSLIDMAVGFVMGGAFATVVSSFLADIFMPVVGRFLGGVDFGSYKITLLEAVGDKPAVYMSIGNFLTALISFLTVAWVMFMIVKGTNKLKAPEADAPPPANEVLLAEIRDLLKR